MTSQTEVSARFTQPKTVITHNQRLFQIEGRAAALQPLVTTMLKDNLASHFPKPGANTTPWQLRVRSWDPARRESVT